MSCKTYKSVHKWRILQANEQGRNLKNSFTSKLLRKMNSWAISDKGLIECLY